MREDKHSREARPCVHVEVMDGELSEALERSLQQTLRQKLAELNADFRQATREDERAGELQVVLHQAGQGPFAQNNGRIKRRYILETARQSASATVSLFNPITAA